MGMMPKKINAENKIIGNISFTMILTCALSAIGGWFLGTLVFAGGGRVTLALAAAVIAFLLLCPAPGNRRQICAKGFLALFRHISKPKTMYGAGSEEQKDRRYRDSIRK